MNCNQIDWVKNNASHNVRDCHAANQHKNLDLLDGLSNDMKINRFGSVGLPEDKKNIL